MGGIRGFGIKVTNDTMALYNGAVPTRVVVETEWGDQNANGELDKNEKLIEISRNYFARPKPAPSATSAST